MSHTLAVLGALLLAVGCSSASNDEPHGTGAAGAGAVGGGGVTGGASGVGGSAGSGSVGGASGVRAGAGGAASGGSAGAASGGSGNAHPGGAAGAFPGAVPANKVIAYYDARTLKSAPQVSSFPDLSGNGNTLTASGQCAPAKLSTASFGGLQSVEFSGQGSCLSAVFGNVVPESYVYWAVVDLLSLPGPSSAALWSVAPNDPAGVAHKNMLGIDSPNTWVTKNMSKVGQAGHYHSQVQATVGPHLIQRNYEPSDQVIVDGQVVIQYEDQSDSPPNDNPTGGLILAARESYERFAHMRVGALLILASPTSAEKTSVSAALSADWNLSITNQP
jgi:hypothetical protein